METNRILDDEEKKSWSDFEKKAEAFVSVVEKGGTESELKSAMDGFKKAMCNYKASKKDKEEKKCA